MVPQVCGSKIISLNNIVSFGGEKMTFVSIIKKILAWRNVPMTPQEIRSVIKEKYIQFYATPSHIRNVKKGHYKDLDNALLAQIYSTVRTNKKAFFCDNSQKPMRISLRTDKIIEAPERITFGYLKKSRQSLPARFAQFDSKVREVLTNAEQYHEAYYKAEIFRGPSLYFHLQALKTQHQPCSLTHLEYVYATLAAWGMHRMGKNGSKMQSFDIFRQSVEVLQDRITEAQKIDLREMTEDKWTLLKEIFLGLNVMASGTSLVGNSKVMHHMIPNIVPPIDREYTLSYLVGNKNIRNDMNWEWDLMKAIIENFFVPVASNKDFAMTADAWIADNEKYPWDTSYLKIVDNLVIGSRKVA
jgi:hypothetical protein